MRTSDDFVLGVLMSEIDTLTFKGYEYIERSASLRAREADVIARIEQQDTELKRLPSQVRSNMGQGGALGAQVSQMQSLLAERVVYDDIEHRLQARFREIVENPDAMRALKTADLRSNAARETLRRAIRPGTLARKRLQLLNAITHVETNIQGEARRSIREYLYGILTTFGANPRGLLNSLEFNYMVMGPPGTGKSHMVKEMASFFYSIGLLVRDRLFTINKSDLVAGYLGQSAGKTRATIYAALEGVLFLDEAYSLLSCEYSDEKREHVRKRDEFGTEAVDQMVDMLSDLKGLIVFVVAGYPNEMTNCFMGSNAGLARRFVNKWNLQRFSREDLLDILQQQLRTIDSSNRFWFRTARVMFPKPADIQQTARDVAPILFALDGMNLLTAQAGDIEVVAHDLYNLMAQNEANGQEVTMDMVVGMFNHFLRGSKGFKVARVTSIDTAGRVHSLDDQGRVHVDGISVLADA